MKRLFIIHGYKATPNDHWLPWLKKEAELKGFHVENPAMPNPSNPDPIKWLAKIEQTVGKVDGNTYFAGHSLGCAAILRFLETEPVNSQTGQVPQVGGVILVGAFAHYIENEAANAFIDMPFHFDKIKANAKKFILIHAKDDENVPYENALFLRDQLAAELITIEKGGHLNMKSGFCDLPIALEKLVEMSS